MPSHHSGIWDFPKLKGSVNYRQWARSMEIALVLEGHWDVIEDDAAYPQSCLEEHGGYNDNGEPIVTAPTEQESDKISEQQVRWKGQNARVKGLIMHKCEESPADLIIGVYEAREQWSKLQKHFEDSGFTSKHLTVQELMDTSLTSCGNSIDTYVTTIQAKANDLKKMNAQLPNWLIVSILLDNLDGKYGDFTHEIITSIGTSEPDLNEIIMMLYREDRYRSRVGRRS